MTRLGARVASALVLASVAARAEEPPVDVEVHALPRRPAGGEQVVSARQAASGAGTQGDPVKAIQITAGTARDAGGDVIAWGSPASETRLLIDGVEVPRLFHGSGIRSIVPAPLLSTVSLSPGAHAVDDGTTLGGVVRLTTADLDPETHHVTLGADTLDATGFGSVAASSRLSVSASGRHGYADSWLPEVGIDPANDLVSVPRYHDWQAQAALAFRRGESLRFVVLASRDVSTQGVGDGNARLARARTHEVAFERVYAVYRRRLAGGATVDVTPWVGRDTDSDQATFESSPFALEQTSWVGGVSAVHRARLARRLVLRSGVDASGRFVDVARQGSLTLPPREGDPFVFGAGPGADLAADRYEVSIVAAAPFAALEASAGPLRLDAGVRAQAFLVETSRIRPRLGDVPPVGHSSLDGSFEPRVRARVELDRAVSLHAAAGTFHQAPAPADLSAVFGNPELPVARSTHLAAGETVLPGGGWMLDATVFSKRSSGLAVRSPAQPPHVAEALLGSGEGRAYGVQLLAKKRIGGAWWASGAATLSRSERRSDGDAPWRLFEKDEPWVLAAAATHEGALWSFGARARAASGAPYTPVRAVHFDLTDQRSEPLTGAAGSRRLPVFFQLDARVDRRFRLGNGVLLAYADLLNVTLHENAEEVVYSSDFRDVGYLTGLPPMAVVGVSYEQ